MNVDLGPVPESVVLNAVRYAVGRTSAAEPAETVAWLVGVWPKVPPATQATIRGSIEEAFRRDDYLRAQGRREGLPLGWDCDRREWLKVRALWAEDQTPKET